MFFIGNKLINKCLVEYKLFRIMIKDCRQICPVCGYDDLDEGPFTEGGYPTYEICPCCGYEFGYDDEATGFYGLVLRFALYVQNIHCRKS